MMKNILFLAVAFIAGSYFGKPLIDKIIKPKPTGGETDIEKTV